MSVDIQQQIVREVSAWVSLLICASQSADPHQDAITNPGAPVHELFERLVTGGTSGSLVPEGLRTGEQRALHVAEELANGIGQPVRRDSQLFCQGGGRRGSGREGLFRYLPDAWHRTRRHAGDADGRPA